jgi:hypothetical protein
VQYTITKGDLRMKATKNEKIVMERLGWTRITKERRRRIRNFDIQTKKVN